MFTLNLMPAWSNKRRERLRKAKQINHHLGYLMSYHVNWQHISEGTRLKTDAEPHILQLDYSYREHFYFFFYCTDIYTDIFGILTVLLNQKL